MNKALSKISDQLDKVVSAIDGLHPGHIDVDIKSAVTDWNIFWATLGAAFLGTASAFLSNVLYEKKRERQHRWNTLNRSKYSLILFLNTLLNFKNQFLIRHNVATETIMRHAGLYSAAPDPQLIQEYRTTIRPIIDFVSNPSRNWNGALQKWDSFDFPNLFKPEELAFTLDDVSDDMRIFVLIVEQLKTIERHIVVRNAAWEEMHNAILPAFRPELSCMGPLHEFLVYRRNIRELVDLTLVVIVEAISRIEKYCKRNYKPTTTGWRSIFMKRKPVHYTLPKQAKYLMPDPKQYASVLHPSQD